VTRAGLTPLDVARDCGGVSVAAVVSMLSAAEEGARKPAAIARNGDEGVSPEEGTEG